MLQGKQIQFKYSSISSIMSLAIPVHHRFNRNMEEMNTKANVKAQHLWATQRSIQIVMECHVIF